MSEKVKIEKGMLAESLNEVLDKAHVPMRHHLSVLKTMDENLAKHKQDRDTHQQMMLAHAKQMSSSEESNRVLLEEMQRRSEEHDAKIVQFKEELARYKTLLQGEPGYTPMKGVDYFDAEAPSIEEIVASVIPHIPEPVKGDKEEDASFDKEAFKKEIVDFLRETKPLDISHIRNAQTFIKNGVTYKIEELMRGAGGGISSGGVSIIPVTGTINDTNETFAAASLPTLLNINGAFYQQTGGAITWSYTSGTITLSSAVGTGGTIYGVK